MTLLKIFTGIALTMWAVSAIATVLWIVVDRMFIGFRK